jgi:hypothetical protein
VIGRPEKALICCGGQAEEKMCEKKVLLPLWPSAKTNFTPAWARWDCFNFRGSFTPVNGLIRKILKEWAVLSFGPMYALRTLAILNSYENVPLTLLYTDCHCHFHNLQQVMISQKGNIKWSDQQIVPDWDLGASGER